MSIITKRSIQLYKQLTPKQLAAVAAGIHDHEELSILGKTVERKTYRMMDAAFLDWSDWFFKISTVLGMAFWQAKAGHLTMMGGANQLANEELDEREQAMLDKVIQNIPLARANMKSALEAMRQLSEQHGFKFTDALRLADIDQHELDRLEGVDVHQERLDYFIDNLGSTTPRTH